MSSEFRLTFQISVLLGCSIMFHFSEVPSSSSVASFK